MAAKRTPDLFRDEAERLAKLPARDRKAEIAVHRRIAEDTRLSVATRNHARTVADTLERLVEGILTNRNNRVDGQQQVCNNTP